MTKRELIQHLSEFGDDDVVAVGRYVKDRDEIEQLIVQGVANIAWHRPRAVLAGLIVDSQNAKIDAISLITGLMNVNEAPASTPPQTPS